MSKLVDLRVKSMKLYLKYKDGSMTLDAYLEQIKPLDNKIDILEVRTLNYTISPLGRMKFNTMCSVKSNDSQLKNVVSI